MSHIKHLWTNHGKNQANQTEARWLSQPVPWQTLLSYALAAVALGYGIWLRVLFFRSFPDPFPTPDTWSYLTGAFGLLQRGQFDLFAQRTPVFPLIVWIMLAVFKSFAALNIVHGILTLLSALAVAYVVRAFGGPWRLPAALALAFLVVHPHLLYWEHFILTEGTFQAFFTLALCAIALAALRTTARHAAAAGVLTAIAVLVRPQGMFLTPLMLLALAWTGRQMGRRKLLMMLVAAGAGPLLLLGGWSARNKVVHGFFGLSNIGPMQLFGVSARWVDLDGPGLVEDKAVIADSIRRYQSMPENLVWVLYDRDGPVYLIDHKYPRNPNRRDEVYSALAREAILHHPLAFARRGISTTLRMVSYKEEYPDFGIVTVQHPDGFATNWFQWNKYWEALESEFPVDEYRAPPDQTRERITKRTSIFDKYIHPVLVCETSFIRASLIITLVTLLTLPLLSGPRRTVVALGGISVILLMLTAGFLADGDQRYLLTIHGSATLAGALAVTGILERSLPQVKQALARRRRRPT